MAHPDDETLWAGGMMLMCPSWDWTVLCLCRGSDPERAPRFFQALAQLGAQGRIGDLDDSPDQRPLAGNEVREAVLCALPHRVCDLVITHGTSGEYTRHRRHEETNAAVTSLWRDGRIAAARLWMFAYEDGGGSRLPAAAQDAHVEFLLPRDIWHKKRAIIEGTYGFGPESFEAGACPGKEAFWSFRSHDRFLQWAEERGVET